MKQKIELGSRVADVITQVEGVVTGHAEYLTGCDQYLVQPEPKAEDRGRVRPPAEWYDENRLKCYGPVPSVLEAIAELSKERFLDDVGTERAGGADLPAPVK